jgi:dephospho-CoA kinase
MGKKTVSQYFFEKNIMPIIKCDIIIEKLLKRGTSFHNSLKNKLTDEYFTDELEINREKLENLLITNPRFR